MSVDPGIEINIRIRVRVRVFWRSNLRVHKGVLCVQQHCKRRRSGLGIGFALGLELGFRAGQGSVQGWEHEQGTVGTGHLEVLLGILAGVQETVHRSVLPRGWCCEGKGNCEGHGAGMIHPA